MLKKRQLEPAGLVHLLIGFGFRRSVDAMRGKGLLGFRWCFLRHGPFAMLQRRAAQGPGRNALTFVWQRLRRLLS